MNRAYTSATADTRPSPAYHPPFPLNTSAHRTTKANPHHQYTPSIASPLTPSSTTSTTAPLLNRASWTRSRAVTTSNTHNSVISQIPASYKDDVSCYTPTSPLPTFPPPPLLADNSDGKYSSGNTKIQAIKVTMPSSKRSRTRTSGADTLYSPLPSSSSTPISPVAYTTDNNIRESAADIDTTSSGIEMLNFHDGQRQPDRHHRSEPAVGGVASHRYASILPSPRCSRTQSTSTSQQQQQQQLSSPLPSPLDSNIDSSVVSTPPPPPPPSQPKPNQREGYVRQPTAPSSFMSNPQQGIVSSNSNSNSNNGNVESNSNKSIEDATAGWKARTTSLHHNVLQGLDQQSQATASMLSEFPLPPTAAGAKGATKTVGVDGRVMPWLQEAMQTVTMLESRLQELEEDCKAIPLYEKDRMEMIQVIQDLDAIVQEDQDWMDHMEMAVRWTTYVLENALISSATSSSSDRDQSVSRKNNDDLREDIQTRARACSHGGLLPGDTNDGENDGAGRGGVGGGMMPGLERNTRSEGMIPSMVALSESERSSCSGLQSSAQFESGTGTRTGTRAGWRLMETSNVEPSAQITTTFTSTTGVITTADGADMTRPSSTTSSCLSSSTLQANKEDVLVAKESSQEALYRNAIMVALRHLKTMDIPPSLSSDSSSSRTGTRRGPTSSRGHGGNRKKESEGWDILKQATKTTTTRRRTKVGAPDSALKDWLDSSSMMSLISNIITEDLYGDEDESENGERSKTEEDLSISRVPATIEDTSSNKIKDTLELDLQAAAMKTPELRSPASSSLAQMCRRRHLLVGSLSPLQSPPNPTSDHPNPTTISPIPNTHSDLLSASTSTETLSHALSTLSLHATISGSSQSFQTNLDNTLLDERVFLKQHILHLNRLRVQEQTRQGRMENGYMQLVQDLERFSKELLGSVNELTCAQAALDEASELALLALSSVDKGAHGGGIVVGGLAGSQQQQLEKANDGGRTISSFGTTTGNNNTTTRQKRLIAASKKELESSGEFAGECIKRIRRLAADCVGITELAAQGRHGQHQQQTFNAARINESFIRPVVTTVGDEGGAAGLQKYAFGATVVPLELEAIPTTVKTSMNTGNMNKKAESILGTTTASTLAVSTSTAAWSVRARSGSEATKDSTIVLQPSTLTSPSYSAASMFVDGIAFQEFEEHLASIRTSPSTNNSATTESTIFKRVFPTSSSARLNTNTMNNNTKANRRNNHSTNSTILSVFMKRVLAEDIYPCLMIHNGNGRALTSAAAPTKQSPGWMSAFLSSSSSTQSSSSLPPLSRGISNSNNNSLQGQWVQRLLKAMEANACEIEAWKPTLPNSTTTIITSTAPVNTGSMLVNNKTAATPKSACCLCGTTRPCEFRLRLLDHPTPSSSSSTSSTSQQQQQKQQQYHALDRFCRERIVAVCDFYMFLGHLRQGLLDQPSSLELFRRALGLRQRMAYARIGSVDLVGGGGGGCETSFSVTHE